MPIDEQTSDELAESLYDAYRSGDPISRLTAENELTIEDAYTIQSQLVERRTNDGEKIVGHKVGLTSQAIQDQLGVDEPDFGRLFDSMFITDRTVPVNELIEPRVEPEVGFLLEERLDPPVTYLDVLNATHAVLPVLEIIDSRILDWEINIQDTISDNASSALYLTGEAISSPEGADLSLEGVKLYRNGMLEASGVGAAVLEHPARAVAWLANTLADKDEQIEAGHVVLSGSFTPAVDIDQGDVLTAEFTSIGSITARLGET